TGEALQTQDSKVMATYRLDQIKAEGQVDIQEARRLRLGDEVLIEPRQEESPERTLTGHLGVIRALAVSREGLIVSGSDDTTVRVWKRNGQVRRVFTGYPSAVQALACSPLSVKDNYCIAGYGDGRLVLFDLSNLAKDKGRVLPEKHAEGVS